MLRTSRRFGISFRKSLGDKELVQNLQNDAEFKQMVAFLAKDKVKS